MMLQKKRGVSEILSYVLLVSLAISLSVVVYPWLRSLVSEQGLVKTECPDGVSMIVETAVCESTGYLNLSMRNKGLFNIDGYIVRVNNESDAGGNPLGIPFIFVANVTLNSTLGPGNFTKGLWEYRIKYGQLTEFEIQPFRMEERTRILCDKAVLRQRIKCA